jgi:hypothetical protein
VTQKKEEKEEDEEDPSQPEPVAKKRSMFDDVDK